MKRPAQRHPSRHPSRRPPPRRLRIRKLLKWSGTLACMLIVMATAACMVWQFISLSDGHSWLVGISGGSVGLAWMTGFQCAAGFDVGLRYPTWSNVREHWIEVGLGPGFLANPGFFLCRLPLWMCFLLIGPPTGWLWWRDRRRIPPGCCAGCGYDLTGNVSGRCPECGAPCKVRSRRWRI